MADRIYTAAEKRAAIERELRYRRRVYARRVAERKMTQALADEQIAIFEAIGEADLMTDALRQAAEALRPFSDAAPGYDPDDGDGNDLAFATYVRIGWLRDARTALAAVEAELARVPEERERLAGEFRQPQGGVNDGS